jgi:hypothetical protein
MTGAKQTSPASVRNTPPLRDVLVRVLGPARVPRGRVLEIASGSGYHAAAFAAALAHLEWQPTDPDADARASIAAYVDEACLPNLRLPMAFDVHDTPWPVERAAAIVCINMIHISPWSATLALFKGAGALLESGQCLITYGPYVIDGDFQADSNAAFDQSLRARNPQWGIRDLKDIVPLAASHGLTLAERIPMPANNHTLIFTKT